MKKLRIAIDLGGLAHVTLFTCRYSRRLEPLFVLAFEDSRGLQRLDGLSCKEAWDYIFRARAHLYTWARQKELSIPLRFDSTGRCLTPFYADIDKVQKFLRKVQAACDKAPKGQVLFY